MATKSLRTKIIYIAGYGRSGSTLLDIVLSNADNGHTVGEISNIFDELDKGEGGFYRDRFMETINKLDLSEHQLSKVKKADKFWGAFDKKYGLFWRTFLDNLLEMSSYEFVIDSSKTTWNTLFRPHNLQKSGFDVNIIYLQASYLKVWRSALKGSNKWLQRNGDKGQKHYAFAIKSVISKFLIDLFTSLFYTDRRYKLIKLKYNDFINDTLNTTNKISHHFNISFINLEDKIVRNEFLVKGGYLGNRLRQENSIIKIKKNG